MAFKWISSYLWTPGIRKKMKNRNFILCNFNIICRQMSLPQRWLRLPLPFCPHKVGSPKGLKQKWQLDIPCSEFAGNKRMRSSSTARLGSIAFLVVSLCLLFGSGRSFKLYRIEFKEAEAPPLLMDEDYEDEWEDYAGLDEESLAEADVILDDIEDSTVDPAWTKEGN